MPQYVVAAIAVWIGSKTIGRFMRDEAGFRRGGVDLILTKLVWTEGIARSQWAKSTFGNYPSVRYDPGTGQTWLNQGGQWAAMQGGELVDASPLDGGRTHAYGQLMPSTTPEKEAERARWSGSGYTSAYNAAYAG